MGTSDDNARNHGAQVDSFRRIEFQLDPPTGDIGPLREIERFPFVPADPARLQQDCCEAYNIQVSGLEQRLRALNYPTGGHRSVRRAGFHSRPDRGGAGDGSGKPSARATFSRSRFLGSPLVTAPRTTPSAGAVLLGVTFEEIDIKKTAELMLTEMDHPFGRGEKVYDVTFRERAGRPAYR